MFRLQPKSTLFPYTTLFRSGNEQRRRDIIVIGGSAGALDAILNIAGAFPQEFTGSIFVVSHIGARSEEHTSELQSRRDLVCRLLLEKKKYMISLSSTICIVI